MVEKKNICNQHKFMSELFQKKKKKLWFQINLKISC